MRYRLSILLFLFTGCALSAQGPQWWMDRGVIDPSSSPNDFAAVNQGQVKNIAILAYQEFLENLPAGPGSELQALIAAWTIPGEDNFVPVNLGQLKHVSRPFYDQLIEVGYWIGDYPWVTVGTPNDYAMANIGQVKNLFAFDVKFDTGSGIPDWWEVKWFGQPGAPGAGSAPSTGDPNISVLQAYLEGRNPVAETIEGTVGEEKVRLSVFLPL